MVGVAGKSKGCVTCRKRKIRCDLGRPICANCQGTKRICGGYVKTTTFLHKTPQTFDQHPRGIPDTTSPIPQNPEHSERQNSSFSETLQRRDNPSTQSLPRSLDTNALGKDQVLLDFVKSTLPTSIYREGTLSWLDTLVPPIEDHGALSLARSAISLGWTGHIERLPDNVMRGRQCYHQSLSRLRKDLTTQPTARSQATIATMSALVLYEMIEFGTYNANGWLAHTSGIEAVASRVTPHAFVAGPIHQVFLFYRTVIIVKSLKSRQKTFLAKEPWRHIPWTWHPKTIFHQLLDLAAEATPLLESCSAHASSFGPANHESVRAKRQLASMALMITRLKQWHANSHIHLPQGPPVPFDGDEIATMLSPPSTEDLDRHWYPCKVPQNESIPFEVLEQARLMFLYWSIVLTLQIEVFQNGWLRMELHDTYARTDIPQRYDFAEDVVRAAISIDAALECADSIMKWFSFATQPVWRTYGSIFTVFSLETIITWYSIYQELPECRSSPQADRTKHLQRSRDILQTQVHGSSMRYFV